MKPRVMEAIIDRKRYSTENATLLAGNDHWDGHNFERSGRNEFLYRTPKGSYFAVHQTCWQGELDRIEPLSEDAAIKLFESLSNPRVPFEAAFPSVELVEA